MSTTIVSSEAKARLMDAVQNYTQPASEKFRVLEEVKQAIVELRKKKASYQAITALLRDTAGIDVSHQTVARYCREMLESKSAKATKKTGHPLTAKPEAANTATSAAAAAQSSSSQAELLPQPPTGSTLHSPRPRGPRIANVRILKQ